MLIYSIGCSADGFIADRTGDFHWSVPSPEQFRFHIELTRDIGVMLLGRNLYETMLGWDFDPSLRETPDEAEFADVWCAIPKIVFSSGLDSVRGNARLARGSLTDEAAAATHATDKHVGIGGATLAASAIQAGLIDEFQIFRNPIIVGGGTPILPPVAESVPLELRETRTFGQVAYERWRRA